MPAVIYCFLYNISATRRWKYKAPALGSLDLRVCREAPCCRGRRESYIFLLFSETGKGGFVGIVMHALVQLLALALSLLSPAWA